MDKYVTVTKLKTQTKANTKKRKISELDHIMHVATTPSTKGHDIWQSASTGHQVSEAGAKSVTYNEARIAKLRAQFPSQKVVEQRAERDSEHIELFDYHADDNTWYAARTSIKNTGDGGLFAGCVFYLDGYMGPQMSDFSLKRQITLNGGVLSVSLQKTRITHVLLSSRGALAGSKILKELKGPNKVKFVKVDWVYKCLELNKRVNEWEYAVTSLQNSHSVGKIFKDQLASVKS